MKSVQTLLSLSRKSDHVPIATTVLIVLNVIPFLLTANNTQASDQLISEYGLRIGSISIALNSLSILPNLLSYSFFHTNILHLISNVVGLAYFGAVVERSLGITRLVVVYFTCAIISALFFGLTEAILSRGEVLLVGASGAVSGLVGVALAHRRTSAYYWLTGEILFFVIGYLMATPIGYAAHAAGLCTGFILARFLRRNDVMKNSRMLICSSVS